MPLNSFVNVDAYFGLMKKIRKFQKNLIGLNTHRLNRRFAQNATQKFHLVYLQFQEKRFLWIEVPNGYTN
ncbi:hypothetical protein FPR_23610 [Faecalibacterium prausnitzii SL3/3]|uniref:Uncharacterized protein n=1 Tax=Faecalibacterium prausnitzii SL3/3 TaxID=657322 RepID=D4KCG7_9FIRM|nr:hypothetical protein FPR_23610 [Faecalibacterium prausnitzii SL3/3]